MSFSFDERKLRFQFDDRWLDVKKYDDHLDYREAIHKLQGTSALDFVAIQGGSDFLFFIEVKDYRLDPIEEQEIKIKALPELVGRKVRDTIAGIVAAHHRGKIEDWGAVVGRMISPDPAIRVLVWIETGFPSGLKGRRGNRLSDLADRLRKRLVWLTPEVFVASLTAGWSPEGLSVVDLPDESPGD